MGFDLLNYSALLALGFAVGMLTGTFGVGGAFLLTPALNIIGIDMVSAVGTSFACLAGKSVLGIWTHYRLGNVDWKLGIICGLSSLAGVELGNVLLLHLQKLGLAGTWVRLSYIFILTAVAVFMIRDYFKLRGDVEGDKSARGGVKQENGPFRALSGTVLRIPPLIFLPHSGIRLSVWTLIVSSIILGLMTGFMGVGGGFVSLPLFIYLLGVPTLIAIGTTVLSISLKSIYGTIVYAISGNVQWVPAALLIAGSVAGVHLGGQITRYVNEITLRSVFALFLLAIAVSVLFKQLGMDIPSTCTIFGSTAFVCLMLLYKARKKVGPGA
jgi:uncharacterized membrane protein YfcA